jgi:glutamate-5-semialdehyde dehydrogenase
MEVRNIARQARAASRKLALVSAETKNAVLITLAQKLMSQQAAVLAANAADIKDARQNGLSDALIDRLLLTPERLEGIARDVEHVAALPDPIGQIFAERTLENGLKLYKQRVPIGVLGVIYEARPNVTIDITSLALKSGNAAILRGGSETIRSNRELVTLIRETLDEHGISEDTIQFIDSPDRALVQVMLRLYDDIDLIIPRGGAGLHKFCKENSLIPVIVGGMGICHLYVDETADLEKALEIIYNAKVQRPSVCNALDTLLVNQAIAADFLPRVITKLEPARVKFKIADDSVSFLNPDSAHGIELAGRDDFDTEWMSLILGLRVVNNLEEAIEHIAVHSTAHSDGILSQNSAAQQQFVNQVDSAAVYVNASTRFTDGAQFGLGAEVAISTQKVHARGPMALEELTSYKWVVWGDGQVRP